MAKLSKFNLLKFSDKTLRKLRSTKVVKQYYFKGQESMFKTIQDYDKYEDLFVNLNIERKFVKPIIEILESNDLIETYHVRGGLHHYDHENQEDFSAEVRLIRIKSEGELFINSSSFVSRYIKEIFYKNIPIIISILSLTLSIYSYFRQEYSTIPKLEKLELRLKDLENTKNQEQIHYQ